MKTATIAAALSFVVPGAGLWFLGKRQWAVVNLVVATALILLLCGVGPASEQVHYVILAVAAGSSGLAHATRTGQKKRVTGARLPRVSIHVPSDSRNGDGNGVGDGDAKLAEASPVTQNRPHAD